MEDNGNTTKISFETDEGISEWYVVDHTRINATDYILVADKPDGDAECMILKDTAADSDRQSIYEEVTDDEELDAVAGMFEDALGDVDII